MIKGQGEPMGSTVLEQIAQRAAGGVMITEDDRRAAREAIADTLACMVAGQRDVATQAVRRGVCPATAGGVGVTLVGGGTAGPATAALVNGTAAHALDFDDNFMPGMSHASAVLVPALLAVAEAGDASGADLVQAYLVGLEAQALVGYGVAPEHYAAGWHATSTIGAIGTAAGCAALMGLDHDGIVQAMSLAVSMASGMKGQFGTSAKPFHAGLAARNAVEAAQLAAAGLFGRRDILERAQGFGALMGGGLAADWTGMADDPAHVIGRVGLSPKIHPCCGSTHNAVDMVIALRQEHGFSADQVAAVDLTVGRANYRNLAYPDPATVMEARFSMQYCVALALMQDRLSLADFQDEAIARPHLRALLGRISMQPFAPKEEAGRERVPHRARIRLTDGRVFSVALAHPRGTLRNPLDVATWQAKIADCFSYAGVPFGAADQAALDGFATQPSLTALTGLIARRSTDRPEPG